MTQIKVKADRPVGPIKPLHGVGQPPFSGMDCSMFKYLTRMGAPYSRLHDVGGNFGGTRYVDIPNVFPDFDADETDPASYDFAFTDVLISELVKAGVEPFYRLGVTIENYCAVNMYRLNPPRDFAKWARICEGVIRHYTEGWANGFNYKIEYWEIWNEPDNAPDIPENQMWWGSRQQYFELYDVTAKYLKQRFPQLKIGGYASCGFYAYAEQQGNPYAACSPRTQYFLDFFDEFLEYIKQNGSPLDFFSWHSYASIQDTLKFCEYARSKLDAAGYTGVEHMCNEWNVEPPIRGSYRHAALLAGWLLAMQNSSLDKAMLYDARLGVSIYGALFNPESRKPYPAYYAFVMFNELFSRKTQVEVTVESAAEVYAVAARDETGTCLMIANVSENMEKLALAGLNAKNVELIGLGGRRELSAAPEYLPGLSVIMIRE